MDEPVHILVVDDETPVLHLFRSYLRSKPQYRVFTADSGRKALDRVQTGDIQCCFTDLSMPGMNGLELAQAIHEFDNTIAVVVMTGVPTMDLAIETLKCGVVEFMIKPFSMNQIPLVVDRVMRERSRLVENFLLKEDQKKYRQMVEVNKKLREKTKEVETINLILQRIDEAQNSADLFDTVVNLSGQITLCDQAALGVLSPETADAAVIASYNRSGDPAAGADDSWMNSEMVRNVSSEGLPCLMRGHNGDDSIVAVPLKIRSNIFGVLTARSGAKGHRFTEKDLYFVNALAEKASSSIENMALYENICENLFATLSSLVRAIEARDFYTRQHSTRVQQISMAIAKEMGFSQDAVNVLEVAGSLHDIGKIGIPDSILLKPGKLTDEEYDIIKKHPVIGGEIVSHFNLWAHEREVVTHHHERWDGHGYPDGLKGGQIPPLARVLAVADVYDAISSDRSYRKKMPEETVLKIIAENAGSQFEPEAVEAFFSLHSAGKLVSEGVGHNEPLLCGARPETQNRSNKGKAAAC